MVVEVQLDERGGRRFWHIQYASRGLLNGVSKVDNWPAEGQPGVPQDRGCFDIWGRALERGSFSSDGLKILGPWAQ